LAIRTDTTMLKSAAASLCQVEGWPRDSDAQQGVEGCVDCLTEQRVSHRRYRRAKNRPDRLTSRLSATYAAYTIGREVRSGCWWDVMSKRGCVRTSCRSTCSARGGCAPKNALMSVT